MLEEESIYYGEKEGRASHGNRYMGLGLLIPLLDQEAEEGNSGFIVLFLYEPSDCGITITQVCGCFSHHSESSLGRASQKYGELSPK